MSNHKHKKVYIPNKSVHDFSAAEKYGKLVFLSEGSIKRFNTSTIYRRFEKILADSSPDDYLMVSGLTMLNIVACHILTKMHGRINLLLFNPQKNGNKSYLERIIK